MLGVHTNEKRLGNAELDITNQNKTIWCGHQKTFSFRTVYNIYCLNINFFFGSLTIRKYFLEPTKIVMNKCGWKDLNSFALVFYVLMRSLLFLIFRFRSPLVFDCY